MELFQRLARILHLSPLLFDFVAVSVLLVLALALGFVLSRILHHYSRKLSHFWISSKVCCAWLLIVSWW